jgi:hypothetical protein
VTSSVERPRAEEEDRGPACCRGSRATRRRLPAGPAPIPRWRLDHGWLRLGRRRPWLGLLRLRSGHARHPLLRRPRLQAGQRRGGPAARRRPSAASVGGAAVQLPLPPSLLLPHSFILYFFLTNSGSGMDMAPAPSGPPSPLTSSPPPLDCGATRRKNPQGASRQGRRRIWGKNPQGGAAQGEAGAARFIGRRLGFRGIGMDGGGRFEAVWRTSA